MNRTDALAPETGALAVTKPWYLPKGDEERVFEQCHREGLAVLLKGPTGCGKTRFVEHMAHKLNRPLFTVACHDDLSASDLVGRWLIRDGETVWQDGPLAQAVRAGGICYLDEVVEARQDTIVVIHALTDHRRLLPIDRTGETLQAAPGFQLVVSYNPGYQHVLKDFKPSTRQRFVAFEFTLPDAQAEAKIVAHESGADLPTARGLVELATRVRRLDGRGLTEVPSTRLLVATARLIRAGIDPKRACLAGLILPLSDDPTVVRGLVELVDAVFV